MNQGAANYAVRVLIQRVLGLACFWFGARSVLGWPVWVYFGTSFMLAIISLVIMFRVNPETLAQRGKVATDSPAWDKVLLGFYWLLHFFVIHHIAGLEWKNAVPNRTLFWMGMGLIVLAFALAMAALVVNTYLESTARIQKEREQVVIKEGVYGVVRHPTYSAVLLSCLGISLVFGTPFVCLTAMVIAAIIVLRTYLEDKLLQKGLAGYLEYTRDVRYRLIPFVW